MRAKPPVRDQSPQPISSASLWTCVVELGGIGEGVVVWFGRRRGGSVVLMVVLKGVE